MTTSGPPNPSDPLACVLARLGHLIDGWMQHVLTRYDLSTSQFQALTYTAHHPGTSQADLARGLGITPQGAGGLAQQLLSKGLLDRTVFHPGHPMMLTLTAAGQRTLDQATPTIEALTHTILRPLPPMTAAALDPCLRQLLATLDHEPPPESWRLFAAGPDGRRMDSPPWSNRAVTDRA